MIYVISYDISDNKKRSKVAAELEKLGLRVQKSVFLADLKVYQKDQICRILDKIIDKKCDQILLIPCCQNCQKRILEIGLETKGYFVL